MVTSLFDYSKRDWQTETEGTVRFALVGAGWWTQEYVLPAIEATELCKTAVVVSSSARKINQIKAKFSSVQHGLDYDSFVAGEKADSYDAVYVCTPNATHYDYVAAAAELGKPVLCEKPMEATLDRAEALVDICNDHSITLMIAYRMHTEPAVRHAREIIQQDAIGDPVFVHGSNSQPLLEMIDDQDQWRLNPDLTGYGATVMDLGIYPLNTARFILDADPIVAQSMMHSSHEAFTDVPDEHAIFSIEFENGTYATCTSTQNGYDHTHLEIIGTDGRLKLEPAFHMETSLTVTQAGTTFSIATEQVDQMEEEFDYFANQILSGRSVYTDGTHGLVDMRTINAIYKAAKSGQTETIELN